MNDSLSRAMLALSIVVLSACTSSNSGWVRDQTPRSAADQDLAQCKYEAASSTASMGSHGKQDSMGSAVNSGVADGVARGMAQADLIKSCMQARGYRH